MKSYEAMIILKSDLPNDALQIASKEAADIIEKYKGNVDDMSELGKRPLAYNVKKAKEGIFYLARFKADPQNVKEMKREFSLNNNILRAMVTVVGG